MAKKGKYYTLKDPETGKEFQTTASEEQLIKYWFGEKSCEPVCEASKAVKNASSGASKSKGKPAQDIAG